MKKTFLIVLALLLAMSFAVAEDIEVSHELEEDTVDAGGEISFDLIITNNMGKDDSFKVFLDPTTPYKKSSPFQLVIPEVTSMDIPAYQTKTKNFYVRIKESAIPEDFYALKLIVESITDEDIKIEYPVPIYIGTPKDLIRITTDLPETVVPGEEALFKVKFRNTANIIVDKAEIYITTTADNEFEKSYVEKIYATPYELEKEISLKLDPSTKPQVYELEIRVFIDKLLRGTLKKTFEVIANPNIESKLETRSGFLNREIIVTKYNKGNVNSDDLYELPLTWFEKLMTEYNIEPSSIAGGKAEWRLTIAPAETKTLIIKTDYRALFFTLIGMFILAVIIIYYMKKVVSIKKAVFKMKDEKGAVSEIKVLIHVMNRTSKPITQIKVVDILPNMLILSHEFGTLKPNKFQKGEKSSRLIWDIDELEPGEERVISYRAKPGLHVIGSLTLPAALLRYTNKEKRIIDLQSNRVTLFSPPPKKTEE